MERLRVIRALKGVEMVFDLIKGGAGIESSGPLSTPLDRLQEQAAAQQGEPWRVLTTAKVPTWQLADGGEPRAGIWLKGHIKRSY
jgi:hypothetical protein